MIVMFRIDYPFPMSCDLWLEFDAKIQLMNIIKSKSYLKEINVAEDSSEILFFAELTLIKRIKIKSEVYTVGISAIF